tara:strand:+ start:101 stop:1822 length:1722 start_codon:yes stop_codon:yes gene_type:complete
MTRYVIDIEADSLDATRIWVACICNVDNDKDIRSFRDAASFLDAVDLEKDTFIAHNGIDFDFPVLEKLWNIEIKNKVDTLVLSRLFNPDRSGGHSLGAWGNRLGFRKIDFNKFDEYSEEMREYCEQDVYITVQLYKHLLQESIDFSQQSIELEHAIADIISRQSRYGFYLDQKKAVDLLVETQSKADTIKSNIKKYFAPKVKVIRDDLPKYTKSGDISKVGLRQFQYKDIAGPFWSIEFEEFNPASHKQVVERMEEAGWKPTEFTPKGSPKVSEANLATLPDTAPEPAKKLSEWKMLETRWKTVESWLNALGNDGRVHGKVFSLGAVTGRMTHADPNMANIVAVYKPYGQQSRECWTVPNNDYRICGMDAQGLELRMLAHYMKDDAYAEEVVNGDPHTVTMQALDIDDRALAKTFIYAFLYGASPSKLGSILNLSQSQGGVIRQRFLNNMPSLQNLLARVEQVSDRGYIRGIDGRRLYVRSSHAALNTLLQGGGAILCKQWSICMDRAIEKERLRAKLVNTIHDELQFEVHRQDADRVAELAQSSIREAGHLLKLRVQMDAEAKIGFSWADTH